MATPGPARIMIFSPPRSLSTAFARSMSARGDTEVFWEPYLSCLQWGRARDKTNPIKGRIGHLVNDKYTYDYISALLNADYPGSKVIFVKCMIEGIKHNFDLVEPGFKHSLLIRDPRKTYMSIVRMFAEFASSSLSSGSDQIPMMETLIDEAYGVIFDDMARFYHHVQSKLDQGAPPIIDADDLVKQPEKILPKYCEAMGIEYTPKMLEWEGVEHTELNWHCTDIGGFVASQRNETTVLSNAMKGSGFGKIPIHAKDIEIPPAVEQMIKHAMPAYEKLYALRIQP